MVRPRCRSGPSGPAGELLPRQYRQPERNAPGEDRRSADKRRGGQCVRRRQRGTADATPAWVAKEHTHSGAARIIDADRRFTETVSTNTTTAAPACTAKQHAYGTGNTTDAESGSAGTANA